MHNDIICKNYVDQYSKLRLFHNDLRNDQQFLSDLNTTLSFTRHLCDENKDHIKPNDCKLLEKVDEIMVNFFDANSSGYKNLNEPEKILAKKVVVQLIKRQIQMLIDRICKPCRKEHDDKKKCEEYMKEFSKLNFLNNAYDYSSVYFINDLKRTLDLISKIHQENRHFSGIDELIKIDVDMYNYFINNRKNPTDIRKIAAELMIHQLYTIIITLCNFCKLTKQDQINTIFNSHLFQSFIELASDPIEFQKLESEIRWPHQGVKKCIQSSEITNPVHFLIEKLGKGQDLSANQKYNVNCILKSDLEDGIPPKQQSLRKSYVQWLISKIESGTLTLEEKRYTNSVFEHTGEIPKETSLLTWYIRESLERFVHLEGITRRIKNYNDLSNDELKKYYSKYFYNFYVHSDIETILDPEWGKKRREAIVLVQQKEQERRAIDAQKKKEEDTRRKALDTDRKKEEEEARKKVIDAQKKEEEEKKASFFAQKEAEKKKALAVEEEKRKALDAQKEERKKKEEEERAQIRAAAREEIKRKEEDRKKKEEERKKRFSVKGGELTEQKFELLLMHKLFYKLAKKTYWVQKYNIVIQKLNNFVK